MNIYIYQAPRSAQLLFANRSDSTNLGWKRGLRGILFRFEIAHGFLRVVSASALAIIAHALCLSPCNNFCTLSSTLRLDRVVYLLGLFGVEEAMPGFCFFCGMSTI
jgi:hypothetical protein